MDTEKTSKLNTLLSMQPPGTVLLSSWLKEKGYSLDLQKRYKKSLWFETIGSGAMIRHGDQVDYLGVVYALQNQAGASIQPAAWLHGHTHSSSNYKLGSCYVACNPKGYPEPEEENRDFNPILTIEV